MLYQELMYVIFFQRKNVNYKNFVFIGRRFRSINKMQLASV